MTTRPWKLARLAYGLLVLMILLLNLATGAEVRAQTTTPPPSSAPAASAAPSPTADAAAILSQANAAATRADDVAKLAEQATTQASRTMTTIQWMLPIFGFLTALAAVVLVGIGLDVRRGTREIQQGYKEQLKEASDAYKEQLKEGRDAYQQMQQRYKGQLDDAAKQLQETEANLAAQTQQIDAIRQEIEGDRERYSALGQALLLLNVANRLLGDGKRSEAIAVYEEARSLQPNDPDINYRLGRAYRYTDRLDESITTLERALNVKPNFPQANMELGLTYRRLADTQSDPDLRRAEYRLAERYLKRAIELRPDYEDALSTLGGLYRREGRYAEALERYLQAANGAEDSSYALGNAASLLWYLGRTESAKQQFDQTDRVATRRIEDRREFGHWDLYDRALARLVLGRAGALDDYRHAIRLTPSVGDFDSVLSNLELLQNSPQTIAGLDEVITLVKQGRARLMERIRS